MSDENVKSVCFVCKKSGKDLIFCSVESYAKCQTILKLRKIHNLKYKDIILPNEHTDSGYHRACYKAFTGLMQKYFRAEPANAENKKNIKQVSGVVTSNLAPSSTSIPELCSEAPDSESDIGIETQTTNGNILLDSVACIFCNRQKKKARSSMVPLHSTDVHRFKASVRSRIVDDDEYTKIICKFDHFSGPKIYYHKKCRLEFDNKLSSLKAKVKKNGVARSPKISSDSFY